MASEEFNKGQRFGTGPVFFTAISTILGAIMFLRFGYAVGNVGLLGGFAIIILGHLVTIPTAMAIAEIATNQKVAGGGEYYIISRSFGLHIGAAIGTALFISQAISVAFYIIAFAQAFQPMFEYLTQLGFSSFWINDKWVSVPGLLILIGLVLTRGADLGVKMLYFVVAILFVSLILFFGGSTDYNANVDVFSMNDTVDRPDNFFYVFAICFPAFTGMTAGVGLSGDLKNPGRSLPLGTLAATLVGMIIYFAIVYKLYTSASPEDLAGDQLAMSKIAAWGPIIPIGLAAATISSALGSIMVAPRTLQALANDKVFPSNMANRWLAKGQEKNNEPVNATLVTAGFAMIFVIIGDVNFVAEIITMFFMVTYGALCTISTLEHITGNPAYRPVFRSRWYISLIGGLSCLFLMFRVNANYAFLALLLMIALYFAFSRAQSERRGIAYLLEGVIFQLSRQMRVYLQKRSRTEEEENWRPSIVCISSQGFQRLSAFNLLRWISNKYGFGTYIHFVEGYLSKESFRKSREELRQLLRLSASVRTNVYIDSLVSPSLTSAIAQVIQLPGVSGKENNMILFEYDKQKPESLNEVIKNLQLIKSANFDLCLLASSERNFGYKREIHIWITNNDYENGNLMILLAYIILGHYDWRQGDIKLYAVYPEEELGESRKNLLELIRTGRLPISKNNVRVLSQKQDIETKQIINQESKFADLTIIGIRSEVVKHEGSQVFSGYEAVGDVLFVNTSASKRIS